MTKRGLSAQRLTDIGLALTVLVIPAQWSLELAGRAHLTLVEPLLALTALGFAWERLRRGQWREIIWPPLEHWAFVGVALLSFGVAEDRMEVLKNTLQFGLCFLLLHVLVTDVLRRNPRALQRGMVLILAGLCINLALAAMQYLGADPDPLSVRGAFGNRNVLGGYLALTLPLCLAPLALGAGRPRWRLLGLAPLALGLGVVLSGAAWIALAVAVAAGLLLLGRRIGVAVWALGLLVLVTFAYPRLPRENNWTLLESIDVYDGMGAPTFRYPEWQVALNVIHDNPWRGVGAGNYQRQINRYYGLIPNPTGPQEPDIQNLYLVLGVSLGVPGLVAFLAMLGLGLRHAGIALRPPGTDPYVRIAAWGGACGLAAYALTAIWSPLLVRGVAPLLGVLLGALHGLAAGGRTTDAAQPADGA